MDFAYITGNKYSHQEGKKCLKKKTNGFPISRNPNRACAQDHPSTQILTLLGFRNSLEILDDPLTKVLNIHGDNVRGRERSQTM